MPFEYDMPQEVRTYDVSWRSHKGAKVQGEQRVTAERVEELFRAAFAADNFAWFYCERNGDPRFKGQNP